LGSGKDSEISDLDSVVEVEESFESMRDFSRWIASAFASVSWRLFSCLTSIWDGVEVEEGSEEISFRRRFREVEVEEDEVEELEAVEEVREVIENEEDEGAEEMEGESDAIVEVELDELHDANDCCAS
jgi:hypothetical protein